MPSRRAISLRRSPTSSETRRPLVSPPGRRAPETVGSGDRLHGSFGPLGRRAAHVCRGWRARRNCPPPSWNDGSRRYGRRAHTSSSTATGVAAMCSVPIGCIDVAARGAAGAEETAAPTGGDQSSTACATDGDQSRLGARFRVRHVRPDAVFAGPSSPAIAEALNTGRGRVESVVLRHTYRHLSPLVADKSARPEPVDEGPRCLSRR